MGTIFHYVTVVAVVVFFLFIVAVSLGFIPGTGPDEEELSEAKSALVDHDARLVDVRTPSEYADNGLEGAVNVPVGEIEQRLDDVGDPDDPVVVYCRSGNRSNQARQKLEDAGFEHVYDLGDHGTAADVVAEVR